MHDEGESVVLAKFHAEMFIPNSFLFELQIAARRTTNRYRKTAGIPKDARLFAGKYLELKHQ